jgi:hypothetical protein
MNPPPEADVLVELLREHERDAIPLPSDVAWDRVVHLARSHSVTPLVSTDLEALAPPQIADAVKQRLRAEVAVTLALARDTAETTTELADAGIAVVPFKGATLALRLYGDVSARSSVDVDLLVRPTDALRARKVLIDHGYESVAGWRSPDRQLRFGNEFKLVSSRTNRLIELQWAPTPAYFGLQLDMDGIFDRSGAITLGGVSVPDLGAEDLFLLLAIHGGKHLWERLVWIADIARLITISPDTDWERVVDDAERTRVLRHVLVALWLAKHLRPDVLLDQSLVNLMERDGSIAELGKAVWDRTLSRDPRTTDAPIHGLDLGLKDRRIDGVLHALRLAAYPTQRDTDWLPDRLRWAYPVMRPVRLGWKYLRGAGDMAAVI